MTKDIFNKANHLIESINQMESEGKKITELYKRNKNKTLTSEDITWLIETNSVNNSYIKRRLEQEFESL